MDIIKYYHTLKYLRLRQILGRIWFRLSRAKPDLRPAPELRPVGKNVWVAHGQRAPMMLSPTKIRFLNEEREVTSADSWHIYPEQKLWLYNLQYFDDLNSRDAGKRREWHENLIERWIEENPPCKGFGWDPYPLSMRIMNWIKWVLCGNQLSSRALNSLAVQVRCLFKRYDYHLLGNHLLVNGKTFIFAGLFSQGPEAERWLRKGIRILEQQIPEQILEDGGHFERCPMYHNLIVEDFLDLLNIYRVYDREPEPSWQIVAQKMLTWAQSMAHPDGQIALFNDAGMEIALTARQLEEYGQRLGLDFGKSRSNKIVHLTNTGYIRSVSGPVAMIANVGSVGPDYLPGHAHADTFSFELSFGDRRLIVDSGSSTYDISPERLQQRGTAAHNTLQIDGQNSSEVWSSFRVARRARVRDVLVSTEGEQIRIQAAHDGYSRLKNGGLHHRTWILSEEELTILDEVDGNDDHEIRLCFDFHPDIDVLQVSENVFKWMDGEGKIGILEMDKILEANVEPSTYHPEFGLSQENQQVVGVVFHSLPLQVISRFKWFDTN